MSFYIEKCKPEDLDTVIAINQAAIPEHYTRDMWEKELQDFPEGFLVAKNNDIVLGYVLSRIDIDTYRDANYTAKTGIIMSLAVLPQYREKGIASKLLIEAINAMIARECNAVILQVRMSNVPAIKLYTRYGLKIVGSINKYYEDGEAAFQMFRPLTITYDVNSYRPKI